jgi:hypothetical protein
MTLNNPAATNEAPGALRITEPLVELIHGGNVMALGTRNERLTPHVVRANGALVSSSRDRVAVLLPGIECGPAIENLGANGRVAFLVVDPHTHSGYQFKGRYLEHRQATADELAISDIHRAKLLAKLSGFYPTFERIYDHYAPAQPICVVIEVHEIYDQTPGPKAGRRVEVA